MFGGDSAGGGLTVTTCLAARDVGLPMPAAIAAFSPGLDHTRSGAAMSTKEGIDPFFTTDGMGHTGEMYLDGQDPNQPLLAPAVLADLTGFPPILLQVGTNELLLDDSVRLAARAPTRMLMSSSTSRRGYRTCSKRSSAGSMSQTRRSSEQPCS